MLIFLLCRRRHRRLQPLKKHPGIKASALNQRPSKKKSPEEEIKVTVVPTPSNQPEMKMEYVPIWKSNNTEECESASQRAFEPYIDETVAKYYKSTVSNDQILWMKNIGTLVQVYVFWDILPMFNPLYDPDATSFEYKLDTFRFVVRDLSNPDVSYRLLGWY